MILFRIISTEVGIVSSAHLCFVGKQSFFVAAAEIFLAGSIGVELGSPFSRICSSCPICNSAGCWMGFVRRVWPMVQKDTHSPESKPFHTIFTGSHQGKVHSPYSAVLCIGSWTGFDNRAVFWLLLSSTVPLTFFPHQRGWELARSWEGTQPSQLIQISQRGIPYHVKTAQIIWAKGERKKWGRLWVFSVCLPEEP